MNTTKKLYLQRALNFILFLIILTIATTGTQAHLIPITGQDATASALDVTLPLFDDFIATMTNGEADVIRGVYVPDVLALRVLQQPSNDSAYVTSVAGVVSQFQDAARSGITGLIAHNFLAGEFFFDLEIGQEVSVVYGDGSVKRFMISELYEYQALQPNSPYSDFLDLDSGETLSSSSLYNLVYTGKHHVTFQTCIANNGNLNWGRLFVIATPLES